MHVAARMSQRVAQPQPRARLTPGGPSPRGVYGALIMSSPGIDNRLVPKTPTNPVMMQSTQRAEPSCTTRTVCARRGATRAPALTMAVLFLSAMPLDDCAHQNAPAWSSRGASAESPGLERASDRVSLTMPPSSNACLGGGGSNHGCAVHAAREQQPSVVATLDPTVSAARRFIDSYSDQVYAKMRDDMARTEAYRKALHGVVRDKTVLDIGTGALALLAVFAAEAGARKVYAVEANQEACIKAQETVHARGLSDVVQVIYGLSTNVTLPERADMLVHEILGEIASIEGASYVIRDAQNRHLKAFPAPSPRMRTSVPSSASSSICPCEMPDGEYWASREFPVILPPGTSTMKLSRFPRRLLLSRTWHMMETLDFELENGLPIRQQHNCTFAIDKKGTFAGFVIRMQASMTPEGQNEIQTWCWDEAAQTESCHGHWAQQMVVFEAVAVQPGDRVELQVHIDTSTFQPSYRFTARLHTNARPPRPRAEGEKKEGGVWGGGDDDGEGASRLGEEGEWEVFLGERFIDTPNFG